MEKLIEYMYYLAQIPAMAYASWDGEFVKSEVFKSIAKLKDNFSKENITYTKLTTENLQQLGFRPWNENMDMLIPMWLFKLLPDNTSLYCPLSGDDFVLRKDADDDYRFGCSAFCLMELKPGK